MSQKVALYTGCYDNYYYPEVSKAMVKVLAKNEITVVVPDQVCCGLPMIAKGNAKGAYRNMEYNVEVLSQLASDGYSLITPCSSCSLFIKREYQSLLNRENVELVSKNMYHFSEYLLRLHRLGELNTNFKSINNTVFYHTPCHLRAQQIGNVTFELLMLIPGINIIHISNDCCGMGGSYGFEKANYKVAKKIGDRLFSEIKEHPSKRIITDCGGCKLQIEAGTASRVDHPILLLEEAYNL
ncbi:heterodisulfide reductase-related iron-sulfur binding cluster [Chloroflexota bacterium]